MISRPCCSPEFFDLQAGRIFRRIYELERARTRGLSSVDSPPGRIDSVSPQTCFRPRDRLCHDVALFDLAVDDAAEHDAHVIGLFFAQRIARGDPVPLFDLAVE